MKVGDCVMFGDRFGSLGKITEAVGDNCFHVQWNYGKDVRGEAITERSHYVRADTLRRIEPSDYGAYVECSAWSERQKELREELLNRLEARGR